MLNFNFDNFYTQKCANGNRPEEIQASLNKAQTAFDQVKSNPPGFVQLLEDLSYVNDIQRWVETRVKGQYDHFVVLGIGGSAIGNIALQKSLKPINWNRMTKSQRKDLPTIDVWDNVDPDFIRSNLEVIDPSRTLFNVISKSGTTAEAMSNYLIVRQILLDKGLSPKDHFVFTTDPEKGVLNQIIAQDGIQKFTIPPTVGGRFSVLTPVGLISAAAAGIDIQQLVKGAAECKQQLLESSIEENPAAVIALHHMLFEEKGMTINVMFSYSNALFYWADWFRQIWAESLGKATDNDGNQINYGLTPVKAIGPTDQHSQVQLYNDGPNDKVITFLKVNQFNHKMTIPSLHTEIEALNYLGEKSLNQLIDAEQQATAYAVKNHGRPNMTVEFPRVDEQHVGEFIFVYELATTLLGYMMNINPFDQPGVEDGKVYTYGLMGRKGFEDKKKEIEGD